MSITKETNNALSIVAIVTVLAPASFCAKTNIQSEKKGLNWNRHSSHVVVTPTIDCVG